MDTLWPWLAVAGLGALHGLSPANGWMFAAACGVRAGGGKHARRALLPIALGHAASILLVLHALTLGVATDQALVQGAAGTLLVGMAAWRLLRHGARRSSLGHGAANARFAATSGIGRAGHAGIALWSCLMSTAHGAGLMLIPALVPVCTAATPAREITASGSLVLALAAVGIHMVAMLVTTGAIAAAVCRGLALRPGLLRGLAPHHAWTATLAIIGLWLVVLR